MWTKLCEIIYISGSVATESDSSSSAVSEKDDKGIRTAAINILGTKVVAIYEIITLYASYT